MAVLIIIIGAVVAFIMIVAMLAVAAAAEHGQLRRIHFAPGACSFPLSMTEAFDRGLSRSAGLQISALRLISSKARGVHYDRLFEMYRKAATRFPELAEGSGFAQWLFFLRSCKLVELAARRVAITPVGREFLRYFG